MNYRTLTLVTVFIWFIIATCSAEEEQLTTKQIYPSLRSDTSRTTLRSLQSRVPHRRSYVKWVLRHGEHTIPGGYIVFSNVSNVVITGDAHCANRTRNCTIRCTGVTNLCVFVFQDSVNITIKHLQFTYPEDKFLSASDPETVLRIVPGRVSSSGYCLEDPNGRSLICLTKRPLVLINVTHLLMFDLVWRGFNSHWTFIHPSGDYTIKNCQLRGIQAAQQMQQRNRNPRYNIVFWIRYPNGFNGSFAGTVSECAFESTGLFNTTATRTVLNNHAIQVSSNIRRSMDVKAIVRITNCTFLGCSAVDIRMKSFPPQAKVEVSRCLINGQATEDSLEKEVYNTLASAFQLILSSGTDTRFVRSCPLCENAPQITITDNNVIGMASMMGSGVNLEYIDYKPEFGCSCMWVKIENNTFRDSWGLKYGSVLHAVYRNTTDIPPSGKMLNSMQYSKIEVAGNIFQGTYARITFCFMLTTLQLSHGRYRTGIEVNFNSTNHCVIGDSGLGVVHVEGFQFGTPQVISTENRIINNKASGMSLLNAKITIPGNNQILGNLAPFGGGVLMNGNSELLLTNSTNLTIADNTALIRGGGIYITENCILLAKKRCSCFFQIASNINSSSQMEFHGRIHIRNNMAMSVKESIFNPNIDACAMNRPLNTRELKMEAFGSIFNISRDDFQKEISSQPHKICLCECDTSGSVRRYCDLGNFPPYVLYPGQNMQLRLCVLGDMNITLSAVLSVTMTTHVHIQIPDNAYHTQYLFGTGCNDVKFDLLHTRTSPVQPGLYYTYLSIPTTENTHDYWKIINLSTFLKTKLDPVCPPGFEKNTSTQKCQCHRKIQALEIQCSLDTMEFNIPYSYWIGMDYTTTTTTNNNNNNNNSVNNSTIGSDSSDGIPAVIVSVNCPPAYCKPETQWPRKIKLNESNENLCLENRGGVLCGQCINRTSVTMWSNTCKICDYTGLLWTVLYILFGPLLIIFICVFNWTISTRSINGLLFYINVMSINSDLLYPRLLVFPQILAFFNLEFGISMCMYTGMTEFGKTMIYFAFPTYLLVLVGLLIFISQRINMHRINKLIGPRITPVLATVVYFSYTMLSKRVAASLLYSTVCNTATNDCYKVWLFDGSLRYLSDWKHIVLSCVALLFLVLVLIPITVVATIGDLFRRFIKKNWYMNFLDTVHGSFRFGFGFWVGLRLLARVVILALRIFTEERTVLPTTAVITLAFMTLQWLLKPFRHLRMECFTHRKLEKYVIEEKKGRNIANGLDCTFLLNLTALYLCLAYLPERADILVALSVVVASVQAVLIFVYHTFEYSPFGRYITRFFRKCWKRYKAYRERRREVPLPPPSPTDLGLPLVLRASDCVDYDDDDGDSSDESGCELRVNGSQTIETYVEEHISTQSMMMKSRNE